MVEPEPSKLMTRVRFPSPAPRTHRSEPKNSDLFFYASLSNATSRNSVTAFRFGMMRTSWLHYRWGFQSIGDFPREILSYILDIGRVLTAGLLIAIVKVMDKYQRWSIRPRKIREAFPAIRRFSVAVQPFERKIDHRSRFCPRMPTRRVLGVARSDLHAGGPANQAGPFSCLRRRGREDAAARGEGVVGYLPRYSLASFTAKRPEFTAHAACDPGANFTS